MMPHKIYWHTEDVLYVELLGHYTIEEMHQVNQQIKTKLDAHNKPTVLLIDVTTLQQFPKRVQQLWIDSRQILNHPTINHIIFLGLDHPIVRFLATVVTSIGKVDFKVVSSIQEADAIVERLRKTHIKQA